MLLTIKIVQPGKKKPLLNNVPIEIQGLENPCTLATLLSKVVMKQVEEFNSKPGENSLVTYLTDTQIERLAGTGKIGFGIQYNAERAILDKAIATTLQGFEDGLFAVFVNEAPVESLTETLYLEEHASLMFVRLTFLAGSIY